MKRVHSYILYFKRKYKNGEMSMISDDQLKVCEKKLLKRQSDLIEKLRNDFEMDLTLTETASELTSFDINHPGDTATALYERSKDLSFKNQFEKELDEI